MTEPSPIARLKIVLDHVEPTVMRRIEVPADLLLDELHTVLQIALGWTDSHLYEFRFKKTRFAIPDPDWDETDAPRDTRKTTLANAMTQTDAKSFKYLYDFGDGWMHSIKLEKSAPPQKDCIYPRLLKATGRCPPEDIGGPWGYRQFLDALADPAHESHAFARELLDGDTFDPETVEVGDIQRTLAGLARSWSRKLNRRT